MTDRKDTDTILQTILQCFDAVGWAISKRPATTIPKSLLFGTGLNVIISDIISDIIPYSAGNRNGSVRDFRKHHLAATLSC